MERFFSPCTAVLCNLYQYSSLKGRVSFRCVYVRYMAQHLLTFLIWGFQISTPSPPSNANSNMTATRRSAIDSTRNARETFEHV